MYSCEYAVRQEMCVAPQPVPALVEMGRTVLVVNEDPGNYLARAEVLQDLFLEEITTLAPYTPQGLHRADRGADHKLMVYIFPYKIFHM